MYCLGRASVWIVGFSLLLVETHSVAAQSPTMATGPSAMDPPPSAPSANALPVLRPRGPCDACHFSGRRALGGTPGREWSCQQHDRGAVR